MSAHCENLRRLAQNDYMIDTNILPDGHMLIEAADYIDALQAEVERLEEARDGALIQDRDHLLAEVERLTATVKRMQETASYMADTYHPSVAQMGLEAELERLRALTADDGYAASFQSLGQYRTALLAALVAGKETA